MANVGRPSKEKTEVLYIRLPQKMAKALRVLADKEQRGLAVTIERIIDKHLAESE